jgi:hypothetical protein
MKQSNKVQKRSRRDAYLKRKKENVKAKIAAAKKGPTTGRVFCCPVGDQSFANVASSSLNRSNGSPTTLLNEPSIRSTISSPWSWMA